MSKSIDLGINFVLFILNCILMILSCLKEKLHTLGNFLRIVMYKDICTLAVPGLISFMAYLYTHRGAKDVKK